MAIPFACDCGKKMTAKEEFAGRRLRCPDCQKVVVIPKPAAAPVAGGSGMMATPQPTLTREEVAALMNTPAPSRTIPVPPPPRRSDLFAKPPAAAIPAAKAPAKAPVKAAPAVAAPVVAPRAAAPVVATAPVVSEPEKTTHPWAVDPSSAQVATPWLPGDEERFQKGVKPAREWEWPIGWIVVLAAIVGLAVWALTPA